MKPLICCESFTIQYNNYKKLKNVLLKLPTMMLRADINSQKYLKRFSCLRIIKYRHWLYKTLGHDIHRNNFKNILSKYQ